MKYESTLSKLFGYAKDTLSKLFGYAKDIVVWLIICTGSVFVPMFFCGLSIYGIYGISISVIAVAAWTTLFAFVLSLPLFSITVICTEFEDPMWYFMAWCYTGGALMGISSAMGIRFLLILQSISDTSLAIIPNAKYLSIGYLVWALVVGIVMTLFQKIRGLRMNEKPGWGYPI